MRTTLLATVSLLALAITPAAFAATSKDAAYDKNSSPVSDSRGNCVRTKWKDATDPCAPPAKPAAPRPVAQAPKPVAPVISRENRTIYFDFNKAELTSTATTKLDTLAAVINDSSAITDVTIHGFTDQIGTAAYNDALANKRVEAVKTYLDSKSRIKPEGDIKGIGKANPTEGCAAIKKRTARISCMSNERRVEIEFNATK